MRTYSLAWPFVLIPGMILLPATVGAPGGSRAPAAISGGRVPVLEESTEIRLAREAVSSSISKDADVYVLRQGHFTRVVTGSNGFACYVGRDTHRDSRFPECFDAEGARTLMPREMMQVELLADGVAPADVPHRLEAAYQAGTLQRPDAPAVTYMMSPHQVLYDGDTRIGPWHPHVMVYLPRASLAQFRLAPPAVSLDSVGSFGVEFVVIVPSWAR